MKREKLKYNNQPLFKIYELGIVPVDAEQLP